MGNSSSTKDKQPSPAAAPVATAASAGGGAPTAAGEAGSGAGAKAGRASGSSGNGGGAAGSAASAAAAAATAAQHSLTASSKHAQPAGLPAPDLRMSAPVPVPKRPDTARRAEQDEQEELPQLNVFGSPLSPVDPLVLPPQLAVSAPSRIEIGRMLAMPWRLPCGESARAEATRLGCGYCFDCLTERLSLHQFCYSFNF